MDDNIAGALRKAEEPKKLLARFPDLKTHKDRWDTQRYVSAEANKLCDKYDLLHNCGCCNDSMLELWPYVEFEETRIYAKGIPFRIGERDYHYSNERPYPGWEQKLRDAGISEAIVGSIETYFKKHPPYDWDSETC